jgi:hypothetical protein
MTTIQLYDKLSSSLLIDDRNERRLVVAWSIPFLLEI